MYENPQDHNDLERLLLDGANRWGIPILDNANELRDLVRLIYVQDHLWAGAPNGSCVFDAFNRIKQKDPMDGWSDDPPFCPNSEPYFKDALSERLEFSVIPAHIRLLSPVVGSERLDCTETNQRARALFLNGYPHTGVVKVEATYWLTTPPILAMLEDPSMGNGYRCVYALPLDGRPDNVELIESCGHSIIARPIPYDQLGGDHSQLLRLLEQNLPDNA